MIVSSYLTFFSFSSFSCRTPTVETRLLMEIKKNRVGIHLFQVLLLCHFSYYYSMLLFKISVTAPRQLSTSASSSTRRTPQTLGTITPLTLLVIPTATTPSWASSRLRIIAYAPWSSCPGSWEVTQPRCSIFLLLLTLTLHRYNPYFFILTVTSY